MPALDLAPTMARELREIVRLAARRAGTNTRLGEKLGVTGGYIGLLIKGTAAKPSVDLCLALALHSDATIVEILEAAGKTEFADLLLQQFGAPRRVTPQTVDDEILGRVIDEWPHLHDKARILIDQFIELMRLYRTRTHAYQGEDRRAHKAT